MISSNQTGVFPITLAQGNIYILVMEDSDAEPILTTAIESRKKEHLLEGFIEIHDTLKNVGINPIPNQIDNKLSMELILKKENRGD